MWMLTTCSLTFDRCVGVLLLTGTPMKNGKPCNLFPLLKAVRHPFGNNQKEYERHFCAGAEKNFGRGRPVWDASGSSNLKQLKRLVASHLLHLTKAQCLAELPPLTRETRKVPVSSRCQLQYIQALKSLVRAKATDFVLSTAARTYVCCFSHYRRTFMLKLLHGRMTMNPYWELYRSFV
jgi:SNF2 family DNA or RNA helicase